MADTTADLIQRLKNKETIPDSGAAYADSVLLEYLDQTLKGYIVPAIEATLEEHFVVTLDKQMPVMPSYSGNSIPVDVGNTFDIPGESTGLRLRDVYVVGNDGSFFNLPRLTPTQAASQNFGNPWGPSLPTYNNQFVGGFYLQGNTVQIFPYGLASNKTIRLTYQRTPADLCLVENAAQIISITGDVVVTNTVQTSWYAGITKVNVISQNAPYDYVKDANVPTQVYTTYAPLKGITLVAVSGNILELPAGTGANIQVGDWICPDGTSVFAQNIPREVLPAMVQKAASMCIHAAGDSEGTNKADREFVDLLGMALKMIAPRVIGKPIKLLPTNSAFRANRGSNFGRW